MSYVTEDEHVDNLTIDEASIDHSALSTSLEDIDEMDTSVEVRSSDTISLVDALQFDACGDVSEEVMTLETMEEHEEAGIVEEKPKTVTIPPLRPLTIAPKPAKLPMSFKPVAGQQLLLVQGAGTGQQIKLLSTGPGLNLSNLSIAKPITIKQANKQNTISLVSPKKMVMKKVAPKTLTKAFDGKSGQQIVVLQKSDAPAAVKLLPSSTQAKHITLSEAQQMGILAGTKIIPHSAKQIVVNKAGQQKAIKIIPQIRSPTKILPAPNVAAAATSSKPQPQRIYLKQTNVPPTTHILPGQIIQVPSGPAGQLHQINIPGKGMQYIKFITTTQSIDAQTTTSSIATATKITAAKMNSASPAKQVLKVGQKLSAAAAAGRTGVGGSQIVVNRTAVTPSKLPGRGGKNASGDAVVPNIPSPDPITMESNGLKTRKPCNCAKSQCLKLYCDCFANGEFCYQCNCMNCYNNIENEEQRQRAIKNCLERNPNAFRPKIGKGKESGETAIRKHTKGCNCKRSGCLKNYCECYEAKIACSSNCKCMGCMNVESAPLALGGNMEVARNSGLAENRNYVSSPTTARKTPVDPLKRKILPRTPLHVDPIEKVRYKCSYCHAPCSAILNINVVVVWKHSFTQPSSYINSAVIDATSNCLVSIAKNAQETGQLDEDTQKEIIEEFGRCLKQIIDCSMGKSSS